MCKQVADRVVDRRATKVNWYAGEVDGVQSTADAVARLEHHTGNAGPPQPRRRGQPRDTRAHNNHPIHGRDHFAHQASMPAPGVQGAKTSFAGVLTDRGMAQPGPTNPLTDAVWVQS